MRADELDTRFDQGEDITQFLDLDQAHRPGYTKQRIDLDLPVWMIQALDQEAERLGITRQALINVWLGDRLNPRLH
ncbi:MAG: CopG family antitoxin [Leptolyngbyaceae cyanobacterium bins.349]|nr:CopG family antitoxin [Leptolyngbyaceae cyanobacterium bins.349]